MRDRKTPHKRRPGTALRSVRHGIVPVGLAVLVLAGALWGTYQFVEPAPPDHLSIATGSDEGAYYRFAQRLQQEFATQGIRLNILTTAGSVENLERLGDDGDAQIAFVQSGIADADQHPKLQGLASVYYEPLWVFSRKNRPLGDINDLAGLKVAAGPEGSGTQRVVEQLLEANGLGGKDPTLTGDTGGKAADALLDGSVDVAMTIAAANSAMVERLLASDEARLMSFSRAAAYGRRYPWFSSLTLPEGVVDLERNIPQRTIRLISVAATLVARSDLHPALGDLTMQAAARVFDEDTLFSKAGRFPSPDYLDFPVSQEAERYYKYGVPLLQR